MSASLPVLGLVAASLLTGSVMLVRSGADNPDVPNDGGALGAGVGYAAGIEDAGGDTDAVSTGVEDALRAGVGDALTSVEDALTSVEDALTSVEDALSVQEANVPYDGRFTFARIRFGAGLNTGSFGGGRGRGRLPPWAHDYPRAERNFMHILRETTLLRPYMDGGNIFTTDDPELTRFPLAYISEPGYWNPTESEVEGLRNYLLKGGFLIADDFRNADWLNFDAQMKRVIPGAEFVVLDESHMIFDSFFRIESLKTLASPTFQVEPVYLGLHEENDPDRRLMAIANYNNDIGEYWEYSDVGWYPMDLSNEAYKLGVNYVIYAMTH